MATEKPKWWKAFMPKRRSGYPKDPASAHAFDPDFDPFAPLPESKREPASAASHSSGEQPKQAQQEPKNTPGHFGDDTYDDSHLDSVFNEQSCRRNMKVSRSGRFKEKRKGHMSLPIQQKETENWEGIR